MGKWKRKDRERGTRHGEKGERGKNEGGKRKITERVD